MPHLPEKLGSFPLTFREYDVPDPKRGELLLNYDNNELYMVRKSDGQIISVARDIYNKILESRIQNNTVYIIDADKMSPVPGKDELVPPISEREYNGFYYIITGRRQYAPESNNPLTAPSWAVKSGKKFMGKASGYTPDESEG